MVFLTVGTVDNDFSRLVEYVDRLVAEGKLEDVFGQIGPSRYTPENYQFHRFLSRTEMERKISEANLVIAHAGTGSANMSLTHSRKLIVVPRKAILGEHPDDHQEELAEYLRRKELALVAVDYDGLCRCIDTLSTWQPAFHDSDRRELPAVAILNSFLAKFTTASTDGREGSDLPKSKEPFRLTKARQKLTSIYYSVKPIIPRWVQITLRRLLMKVERQKYKSVWPILPGSETPPEEWPGWPAGKRFCVVLTHDVEFSGREERCLRILHQERELGFRSAFNFVPMRSSLTPQLETELNSNDFEIGVHGLFHDGKLFRTREFFESRASVINEYIRRWNATGFRAPAMHHNLKWIPELDVTYDASTFDTDPFEPQADGIGSIYPLFLQHEDAKKGFVELPYTLPQDHTLFVIMQERNIDIWKQKLDWIANSGGMALVNTHPDYMSFEDRRRRIDEYPASYYFELLEYMRTTHTDAYWNALPREVAAFIRATHEKIPLCK